MDEDPYVNVDPTVLEVEAIFDQTLVLNNKVGTDLDKFMQPAKISTLQELEDFLGTWYNNYNAS